MIGTEQKGHGLWSSMSARVQLELGAAAFQDAMRASTSTSSGFSACPAWHQLHNCTASAEPCSLWSMQNGCANAAHRLARSGGVAALRRRDVYVWDELKQRSMFKLNRHLDKLLETVPGLEMKKTELQTVPGLVSWRVGRAIAARCLADSHSLSACAFRSSTTATFQRG